MRLRFGCTTMSVGLPGCSTITVPSGGQKTGRRQCSYTTFLHFSKRKAPSTSTFASVLPGPILTIFGLHHRGCDARQTARHTVIYTEILRVGLILPRQHARPIKKRLLHYCTALTPIRYLVD